MEQQSLRTVDLGQLIKRIFTTDKGRLSQTTPPLLFRPAALQESQANAGAG